MVDSPLANYYQNASGTIAGFDGIDLPTNDPTLSRSGWSIEQIRKFLLNESGTNFPTSERVDEIEALVNAHIADTNNPHGVSATAIAQSVSDSVLSGFIPGTPPPSAPFFAYDSAAPLPMDTVYPATYTSSNFYRMVEGGRFVDPATESDVLGTDMINGAIGLPLYSSLSNVVPLTWPTNVSLPINTRVTKVANTTVSYPFDFYRVDETNATGDFGVGIPVQLSGASVYTFTVFLQPLYLNGYFVIKQSGNDEAVMLVNTESGGFILGSDSVQGDVTVYPSGVMKVSYSFVAASTGFSRILVLHRQSANPEPTRIGRNGQVLFLLAMPLVSNAPIGAPLPVNPAQAAFATAMVPKLSVLGVPGVLPRLMINMSVILRKQLSAFPLSDTVLFQFGNLTLVRDTSKVYLKLGTQTLCTGTLVNGLNVFSVSYSPTEVMFKDLATAKQVVPGTYPALQTDSVRVGPCAGHLRQFLIYPDNDRAKCLEFLTNG